MSELSESRRVLGRGSIYTLGTAAPILTGVLVTPLLTRSLGPSEYGWVTLGVAIVQFGSILAGAGLTLSITRHGLLGADGSAGARGLVVVASSTSLVLAFIGMATAQSWAPWALDAVNWGTVMLACVAAGTAGISSNVQAYLRSVDQAWRFVGISAALSFLAPLVGYAVVVLRAPSATNYLMGLLVVYACTGAFGLAGVLRAGLLLRWSNIVEAFRVGLPMLPHQLSMQLLTGATLVLAARALGVAQSGSLQVAFYVGTLPLVFVTSMNNAWVPVIMKAADGERGPAIERTARDIGMLAGLVGGALAFSAPIPLRLLAPASFDQVGMAMATSILAPVALLSVVYLGSSHLIFVSGRTEGLAIGTPLSLILGLFIAYAALPRIGLPGGALGYFCSYVLLALITTLISRKVGAEAWNLRCVAFPATVVLASSIVAVFLPIEGLGLAVRLVGTLTLAVWGLIFLRRVLGQR